ncbi:MAG: minichromosome maintenance protein MCM [Candidatus Brockarchaeota archaeon]|nr:minichromosome maintenance protein MCM [Candidatus Brockarchaeota archaeon]
MEDSRVRSKTPIQSLFLDFLRNFRDENNERKYYDQIASLPSLGASSIVIDFQDMLSYNREIVEEIVENPSVLEELGSIALSILSSLDRDYASKIQRVAVRIRGLGKKISIRDIKSSLLGKLVCFEGVVVRASEIKSILVKGVFQCKTCGSIYEEPQTGLVLKPPRCDVCGTSKLSNFELLQDRSEFMDYQEIRVQEKPEDLPAGVMPHSINLRLTGDLTDRVRPGDRVQITGVVTATPDRHPLKNLQYTTFSLSIEVNYIEALMQELGEVTLTPEEEKKIIEMSRDPWIYQKLIKSIAPSIYGLEEIKEAILLQMVGGVRRTYPDGVTVRGDINLLLIGDPGTAKSQLLKYVQRIAPRGLYTSGRGVTAAGLTAAVVRDKTGSFTLEAGAVVLADKGIAAIDEFEKMKAEDRVAIHEAMEQQTVSVAKGGIVATLNARTAILAAANPVYGRYDDSLNFSENVDLPPTLLSRFDLYFIIKDRPDKEADAKLSDHILQLHMEAYNYSDEIIPPDLLRKYLAYCKRIVPRLTPEATERIKNFFLQLRGSSQEANAPIPITPRHLESLIRLSVARARVMLRDEVTVEDAEVAIRLMDYSLRTAGLDVSTGKVDIDILMTGKSRSKWEKVRIILKEIENLEAETGKALLSELRKRCEEKKIEPDEFYKLIEQMREQGVIMFPDEETVRRIRR